MVQESVSSKGLRTNGILDTSEEDCSRTAYRPNSLRKSTCN